MIEREVKEIKIHGKQREAFMALEDPAVTAVLYGGAKGGGKSVFACIYNYWYACKIIKDYGLTPSEYPVPIAFMGRLRSVDFKKSTLDTWKTVIPPRCYRLNKSDQEIIIGDAVKIYYGGLDDTSTINKFNSAEFGMITLDQAEECGMDDVAVLRASLRKKINDRSLPYKELYTANPAQCWLKTEFITAPRPGFRFIQALPTDNPYLDKGYIERLRLAFGHHPELLEAYLAGSWDAHADADQIIREQWVRQALQRKIPKLMFRRFLVCDVARFGDDETVIYLFEETDIAKAKIYGKKDTMHTANVLHVCAVQEEVSAVVVDEDGVGGGVVDRLREMANGQYEVIGINSAAKPNHKPELYGNLRAEMWDMTGAKLEAGDIELTYVDQKMFTQLCTPKYYFRNGKMYVEKKEDLKNPKRLGCSPDRADPFVIGEYILDSIPVGKSDRERRHRSSYRSRLRATASAMAV